jgi:hypothetical protein
MKKKDYKTFWRYSDTGCGFWNYAFGHFGDNGSLWQVTVYKMKNGEYDIVPLGERQVKANVYWIDLTKYQKYSSNQFEKMFPCYSRGNHATQKEQTKKVKAYRKLLSKP